MTVIDASALAAYVLREEGWESIERILREGGISVQLLAVEAANAVLSARRQRRVAALEANEALDLVRSLAEKAISLVPHPPLLPAAWEIAGRYDLTIYDSIYLALAQREHVGLASRDSTQIRAARTMGLRVTET